MKKTIAFAALSSVIFFTACKKNNSENAGKEVQTEIKNDQFVVDSVLVKDSVKMNEKLSVKYEAKILVFPSIKDKALLDSIYYYKNGITDFSRQGLKIFLEKDKQDYFSSLKNKNTDWMGDLPNPQTWETGSYMKLKSISEDFLQIEYLFSSYEGGAHGNYGFSERVFDLKNNKKVQLKDITTIEKTKLEELLKKNIDKIPSGITSGQETMKNSDMLLEDVIPANDNFYFDDKNLYFHYSPYEIAAFAAGDIVIPVSWEDLKGTISPQFEGRVKK
ncbi:DUF3298 and DUF4163 domain-containing protein [Chryseobacterium binzhouense]|uniref:DUF3298 and DUF4163 domain-containing protein n=1 Tax=Chryseobacterium binzhouense TaxID=2593646 RepID=UPI00117C6D8A|nr:DUF3298 and DUF4163 domain-containing protein [Chryseobacterium binzhouense]